VLVGVRRQITMSRTHEYVTRVVMAAVSTQKATVLHGIL
jgi:hypothetical protein